MISEQRARELFRDKPESFYAQFRDTPLAPKLPAKESKPLRRKKLLGHEASAGPSLPSVAVIITRCSTGTLDRDNLYRAAKPLVDGLRARSLIPNDREQDIELFCFQRKVKQKEIGTLVEIVPL